MAEIDPTRIIQKNKFHLFNHLPEHIIRFGSAILFSTERYESFNHLFRQCSVHSNRQSPSRDIARTFARFDRVRHVLCGGQWFSKVGRKHVRASQHVTDCLSKYKNAAHVVSCIPDAVSPSSSVKFKVGSVTLAKRQDPRRPNPPVKWEETLASRVPGVIPLVHHNWSVCESIVVGNGDRARKGSHVLIKTPGTGMMVGHPNQ